MKKFTLFLLLFTSYSLLFSQAQKTPKDFEQTIIKMQTTIDSLSHLQKILKEDNKILREEAKDVLEQTKFYSSVSSWTITAAIAIITFAIAIIAGLKYFENKKMVQVRKELLEDAKIDLTEQKNTFLTLMQGEMRINLDAFKNNINNAWEDKKEKSDTEISTSIENMTKGIEPFFARIKDETLYSFNIIAKNEIEKYKVDAIEEVKNNIRNLFNTGVQQ